MNKFNHLSVALLGLMLGLGASGRALAADTTPPGIVPNIAGTAGANGWYTSNVQLTWTVADPESRITSKSGCGSVSVTADTAGVTYTCSATSRGGSASKSVTIKRDTRAPTATVSAPASGASYALNRAVNANYTCADTTSGVASCAGPVANGAVVDTASPGAKSFAVTATDNAGKTYTRTVSYTVLGDNTPPKITPTVTGTLGANGWYTSAVGVSFAVSDAESAISASSGCDAANVASDTAGTTFTCSATSGGGTSSQSVTVKRDATAPTINIVAPANGAAYPQGQALTAAYSCQDPVSGAASCVGTVANGGAISLSTTGSATFTVNAADQAGNKAASAVAYSVVANVTSAKGTRLLAWNDLGMHCADSDFSVFTLLPPFNTVNAQLIVGSKLVNSASSAGYSLTYQALADPTGSINTTSQGKSNFWDFDQELFNANLPADTGLTGNPTASNVPAPLQWSAATNWFEATGIPILPIDDNHQPNYFPMVRVTAKDSAGKAIATSDAVLPVSSEINCNTCHASGTGSPAAKPAKGWVDDADKAEKDWRLNILRLHDERNAGPAYDGLLAKKAYSPSLEASALGGRPVLCDTCHKSNALVPWGVAGEAGVSNMTAAMHGRHANVSLPGSGAALDSVSTRDTCYNCHPGKQTQCLRGAMGNPVDAATGQHSMECQSCHGSMQTVGRQAREGWLDVPTCQSCHHDGKRETVAINADGSFKSWNDTRFATNPDTPGVGLSLYRFSTGHGNLQCEACHNSTHAEYTNKPSASGNQVNDNLRAIQAQGYAAALRECSVCHATTPQTNTGGPHGMHEVGASWVSRHHDVVKESSSVPTACAACHGKDNKGSPLAVVKVAKTFNIEGRSKSFAAEDRVTCWSCHNGPNP